MEKILLTIIISKIIDWVIKIDKLGILAIKMIIIKQFWNIDYKINNFAYNCRLRN